jgi:hypothetical protein
MKAHDNGFVVPSIYNLAVHGRDFSALRSSYFSTEYIWYAVDRRLGGSQIPPGSFGKEEDFPLVGTPEFLVRPA